MHRLDALRPRLPYVSAAARASGQDFESLLLRYLTLPKVPLTVRATFATNHLPGLGGSMHLDSLLGAAVVQSYPYPVDFAGQTRVVPVPLEPLWISAEGLPLWAASVLQPSGKHYTGRAYLHKRYPVAHVEWSTKTNANTSAGRWKEYRLPLAPRVLDTEQGACVEAVCLGCQEEIERLLTYITHVGKRSGSGFGRVLRWSVEPRDEYPDVTRLLIQRRRPMVAGYFLDTYGSLDLGNWVRQGWTPPYWYTPWHEPCLEWTDGAA